jgi:hypothetical protein
VLSTIKLLGPDLYRGTRHPDWGNCRHSTSIRQRSRPSKLILYLSTYHSALYSVRVFKSPNSCQMRTPERFSISTDVKCAVVFEEWMYFYRIFVTICTLQCLVHLNIRNCIYSLLILQEINQHGAVGIIENCPHNFSSRWYESGLLLLDM